MNKKNERINVCNEQTKKQANKWMTPSVKLMRLNFYSLIRETRLLLFLQMTFWLGIKMAGICPSGDQYITIAYL